jgi:hypothetical protein
MRESDTSGPELDVASANKHAETLRIFIRVLEFDRVRVVRSWSRQFLSVTAQCPVAKIMI